MDEDTKHKTHFYWARICVQSKAEVPPKELERMIDGVRFKISILEDQISNIIADGDAVASFREGKNGGSRVEVTADRRFLDPIEEDRGKPFGT